MCSSLSIDVINFKDYDTVTYSLILIKGIVNCESSVSLNSEIECSSYRTTNKWPIISNNFRCLVLLREGENKLLLKFRVVTKTIYIKFRRRSSNYCVFPVHIVFNSEETNGNECCDNVSESIREKISFCAKLLQCFYAEKIYENGFGHKTFQLIDDINDNYNGCYLFRSKLSLDKAKLLSPEILWETLGREIMKSEIGNPRCKYLGVTSLYSIIDEVPISAEIALGSGGLALIDSHPIFTWPSAVTDVLSCFRDTTPLLPPLCRNVWYKGTKGGCCSASIGSLCHELGHTFDLGHPSSGIMSTDFHLFHSAFIPDNIQFRTQTIFDLHFIPNITTVSSKSSNFSKVTKLKKPLSATSTKQVKKIVDESSFTPGCVAILSHHKWFNDFNYYSKIEFDRSRVVLQSEAGLKVVQMRGENGKVIKSWELSGEKTEHMILPRIQSCSSVFAMDNYGNISRFSFNNQVVN